MTFARRLAVAVGCMMLLSGCLLTPGKFTSTLDIKRDRSFTFTYVGEVIAQPPSSSTDGDNSLTPEAPSPDKAVMMRIASPEKPAPAADPAAKHAQKMQALAETLSKEYGYRSVKYLGNYRFAVDYQVSGRLTHAFLFPFNIDGEVIVPFLAIELREKDRARLKAPGFANDDSKGMGMPGMGGMGGGGMGSSPDKDAASALDGTFTLTTDAEIVSQNQENGAQTLADGRKRIVWRATPQTRDAPTAVLRFDALP
jgi:hypothetical protein